MERYKILEVVGKGSWGKVYKAIHKETFETVAVKKLKQYYSWEECTNLIEVKALQKLVHPNIVKLKEIVREHGVLFLIFEYMECDLYQKVRTRESPFIEEEIRELLSQILQGLAHMHRHGYIHRDLKPENLLVKSNVLKIADLGMAREISSTDPYTEYVSTRWYRAPEILFQSSSYTSAIDMWAVGAILAELFIRSPIFPGESEIDQLYKICCVLGAPDWISFPIAKNVPRLIEVSSSRILPANISEIIPNASPEAIDLFKELCSWDPLKRPTADQALQHPFFQAGLWIPYQLQDPLELTLNTNGECLKDGLPNLDLNLWEADIQRDEDAVSLKLTVNSNAADLALSRAGMAHRVSQETGEDMLLDFNLSCQPQQLRDRLLDFNLSSQPQQSGDMLSDFNLSSQPQQLGDMFFDFNRYWQLQQSSDMLLDLNLYCQPQQTGDMLLNFNLYCQPQQSVSWPLISPNLDERHVPLDYSLSLPFSYPYQHSQIGVPQLTGCSSASMQRSVLNQQLFETSTPSQFHHYF